MNDQHIKTALDGTLGAGGFTSPLWLQLLDHGAQTVTLIGGAILIIVRLYFAYLEWRERRATGRWR
jgi:hypothetical protein